MKFCLFIIKLTIAYFKYMYVDNRKITGFENQYSNNFHLTMRKEVNSLQSNNMSEFIR